MNRFISTMIGRGVGWRLLAAVGAWALCPVAGSSLWAGPLDGEKSLPAHLEVSSPLDYQVFQRARREDGTVGIAGRFPDGFKAGDVLEVLWEEATPKMMEANRGLEPEVGLAGTLAPPTAGTRGGASVPASLESASPSAGSRAGPGAPEGWRALARPVPDQDAFQDRMSLPAGGWYRLTLRVRRGEVVLAEGQVAHVGVGDVFVIAGQSNSANHGEEKQTVRSGLVASFSGREWRLANDPQPGASGDGGSFIPPFGDALVRKFGVPIGVVAAGAGGTSVREWLPRGTRFPDPPTVTDRVRRLDTGEWESQGRLFDNLVERIMPLGPGGFRALLWHQGESDANQRDPTRTLPGELYRKFMGQFIRELRREAGWELPWFVAQATYHTPDDPGSPDIRAAQAALWGSGLAMEGPDTDALQGDMRDQNGRGVHFSGQGLRAHAALWVEKISPWLESQWAESRPAASVNGPPVGGPSPRLTPPGMETFTIGGQPAFVFMPPAEKRGRPQPWVFYAPTLPAYPDQAERWMHEQFLSSGIAVAGVDVGEAYGSPQSHEVFELLYRDMVERRGFAAKPCLLGRSRGGLWVSSWAIAHPHRVAGLAGIYPVFDWQTYPGLTRAAPAYGLTPGQLAARVQDLNPVARLEVLARARVPVLLIHGDADTVVPLPENSGELLRHYREAGEESLARLIVLEGLGHSYDRGFFRSGELVDFVIARARAGARP